MAGFEVIIEAWPGQCLVSRLRAKLLLLGRV
jgi:hypothetical protein